MGRKKTTTVIQGPTQAELDQRQRQHDEQMALLKAQQAKQAAYQQSQLAKAQKQAEEQRQNLLRQEEANAAYRRVGLISQRVAEANQMAQQAEGVGQAESTQQAQTNQLSRVNSRTKKSAADESRVRQGLISAFIQRQQGRGLI